MTPMTSDQTYQAEGFSPTPELSSERQTRFSQVPELGDGIEPGKSYRAVLETSKGRLVIELYSDDAPMTVNSFAYLIRHHYYDGIKFHRVIDGFMAQGGDPTGTGTSGSKKPDLKAEFNSEPHVRGVCSMARTNQPNSANSQFFICLDDATFLDRQYTVWGEVTDGMELIDALPKGEPPREPGKIVKAKAE